LQTPQTIYYGAGEGDEDLVLAQTSVTTSGPGILLINYSGVVEIEQSLGLDYDSFSVHQLTVNGDVIAEKELRAAGAGEGVSSRATLDLGLSKAFAVSQAGTYTIERAADFSNSSSCTHTIKGGWLDVVFLPSQ
jgi:hypothetical protein